MKTGYKLLIGAGAFTAIALLLSSFKSDKKSGSGANESVEPNEKATTTQFDKLVDLATERKSDMFENASASDLARMRATFVSNLTKDEASELLSLLSTKENDWKASDKINFENISNKWRGKPNNTGVVPPSPKPVVPMTAVAAKAYSPEYDKDYSSKTSVIEKWYTHVKAENKKRVIPRIVPSQSKFMKQFLPWDLNDLKTYVALVYKGEKSRDARDNSIMSKLKTKYIVSFKGNDKIYTNFAGSNVYLPNLS